MRKLCDFGCGNEAIYKFKNGKWCCSEHQNSYPKIRNQMKKQLHRKLKRTEESKNKQKETLKRKGSLIGEKNGMFGRIGELNPFFW